MSSHSHRFAVVVLALAWAQMFSAADMTFVGSLEKVTSESISILLPDGIIIDALLPSMGSLSAEKVSAGRFVGDQVEMKVTTINPVYDERAELYRHLELKSLKPTRTGAGPASLSKALASRVWKESGNILKPSSTTALPVRTDSSRAITGEAAAVLERARAVNLQLLNNLPNFLADEAVSRFRSGTGGSAETSLFDTFLSEISVQGTRELRQRITRDGSLWTQPFAAIPGFRWFAGFGTQLGPLFLQRCPTSFEFQEQREFNGRQVWVYGFNAPADGCFGYLYAQYQRYYPDLTGRVFIDGASGNIVRYEERAVGLPAAFRYQQSEKEIDWADRKIGDASYLLPVSAQFRVRFSSGGDAWLVNVEYRNHRHFESSLELRFGEQVSEK